MLLDDAIILIKSISEE